MVFSLFWYLHRYAMDGAVLAYDNRCIERDDLTAGEGLLNDTDGCLVLCGLIINRENDSAIDDEEVGIGRGKSLIIIHHGIGHGEFQEPVRLVLRCAKRFQFLFQFAKVLILWIVLVLASYIDEGVVGTDPYNRVDVTVRIIADEVAVVEPNDALSAERVLKCLL
jgi:hypothetical protein